METYVDKRYKHINYIRATNKSVEEQRLALDSGFCPRCKEELMYYEIGNYSTTACYCCNYVAHSENKANKVIVWLDVKPDGKVSVSFRIKFIDKKWRHNNYIDLKDGPIMKQKLRLDKGVCPRCNRCLGISDEDKCNRSFCHECNYEAWSDKIFYI